MALPGNLTTITVTGTFLAADGSPCAGMVTFTPSTVLTDATGPAIFPLIPVRVTLDSSGTLSVILPVTSDTDLSPGGWSYKIEELITASQPAPQPPVTVTRSYAVALPSSLGSTVDLAALTHI